MEKKTLDQFTCGSKKTYLNPNTETKPYAATICQPEERVISTEEIQFNHKPAKMLLTEKKKGVSQNGQTPSIIGICSYCVLDRPVFERCQTLLHPELTPWWSFLLADGAHHKKPHSPTHPHQNTQCKQFQNTQCKQFQNTQYIKTRCIKNRLSSNNSRSHDWIIIQVTKTIIQSTSYKNASHQQKWSTHMFKHLKYCEHSDHNNGLLWKLIKPASNDFAYFS